MWTPKAAVAMAVVVLSSLVTGTSVAAAPTPDVPPNDMHIRATAIAAEYARAPVASMRVVHAATVRYPTLGRSVYRFNVVDTRPAGVLQPINLDMAGNEVDIIDLERDEQQARLKRYGRLDPALYGRLAQAKPDEALDVVVWLTDREAEPPARLNPDTRVTTAQADEFLRGIDARRAAHVTTVNEPIGKRLAGLGYKPRAHAYSPAIHVRMPASRVREVAGWSEVDQIYLAQIDEPELRDAGRFIGASNVHAGTIVSGGITANQRGFGIKIGLIEVGGLVGQHTKLGAINQDSTFVCSTPSIHSTALAGLLVSQDSTHTGIAPDASVIATGSCSGSQFELENRAAFALDRGAHVLNLSFGTNTNLALTAHDRYFDDVVAFRLRQAVKSAGNENPCSGMNSRTSNVTSPGLAYNVLAVGAFDDASPTGMWPCSSGADPISRAGDRHKPELAAPGIDINTTVANTFGGMGSTIGPFGGATSFAAPMVSASLALLLQREQVLSTYPEVLRAILMATAIHDREGTLAISEFDGAGGIDVEQANIATLRRVKSTWTTAEPWCGSDEQLMAFTWLNAEQRVRIAMSWNNDSTAGATWSFRRDPNNPSWWVLVPSGGMWPDQPSANLDLLIRGPSGSIVASSTSFDNNHELVDFRAPQSGRYDMLVQAQRCASTHQLIGWSLWTP